MLYEVITQSFAKNVSFVVMKQSLNFIFCFLFCCVTVSLKVEAQQNPDVSKAQLANKYYNTKAFDKAAGLYDELYQSTKSPHYFEFYLTCLIESDQLEIAEKSYNFV